MSTPIKASKATRVALLEAATLNVFGQKTVSAITKSGTTATVTCTAHGYSANDWVLLGTASHPYYNGPFQVASVVDANNITVTLRADPGVSGSGSMTVQKGLGLTNIWGDGTTPTGSPASVGNLSTAVIAQLGVRFTNTGSPPVVAATALVYVSDTGGPGTWESVSGSPVGDVTAGSDNVRRVDLSEARFALVFFYGNTSNTLICSAWGYEVTEASG